MKFLTELKTVFMQAAIKRGNERARLELLKMSDYQLADNGFSRELLERGISAWPWKVPEEADQPLKLQVVDRVHTNDIKELKVIKRAVQDLNHYSDNELKKLGISRHELANAVKQGKPVADTLFENHSQVA